MAETMHSFMAIKRHARASEIAEFVAFVAGPHGAMITGSQLTIDGGFSAQRVLIGFSSRTFGARGGVCEPKQCKGWTVPFGPTYPR